MRKSLAQLLKNAKRVKSPYSGIEYKILLSDKNRILADREEAGSCRPYLTYRQAGIKVMELRSFKTLHAALEDFKKHIKEEPAITEQEKIQRRMTEERIRMIERYLRERRKEKQKEEEFEIIH